MSYTNDTKPSPSFTNDSEASTVPYTLTIGSPIGLLLSLTYATSLSADFYTNDSK